MFSCRIERHRVKLQPAEGRVHLECGSRKEQPAQPPPASAGSIGRVGRQKRPGDPDHRNEPNPDAERQGHPKRVCRVGKSAAEKNHGKSKSNEKADPAATT